MTETTIKQSEPFDSIKLTKTEDGDVIFKIPMNKIHLRKDHIKDIILALQQMNQTTQASNGE